MARLAHAVIVHCEYAREMVMRRYGRQRGVFVVPHPNYIGVYPGNPTREEARAALDLPPGATTFLCFGQMRPNKGTEILLEAFARLEGQALRLVIAGAPGRDQDYVEHLHRQANQDPRIMFRAEQIPDDQVQTYFAASDIAVMTFDRVLTSGSVVLAMSLGKPVIAPRKGCLPETIPADAGWLYDPKDQTGLQRAMLSSLASDLSAAGSRARSVAESWTWTEYAKRTRNAYGATE